MCRVARAAGLVRGAERVRALRGCGRRERQQGAQGAQQRQTNGATHGGIRGVTPSCSFLRPSPRKLWPPPVPAHACSCNPLQQQQHPSCCHSVPELPWSTESRCCLRHVLRHFPARAIVLPAPFSCLRDCPARVIVLSRVIVMGAEVSPAVTLHEAVALGQAVAVAISDLRSHHRALDRLGIGAMRWCVYPGGDRQLLRSSPRGVDAGQGGCRLAGRSGWGSSTGAAILAVAAPALPWQGTLDRAELPQS
jgi:hypothetical protein